MINPLRSEAEAFRFVLATLAYFAAIVIAAVLGGRWVGLAVFIALSALVVGWWARARRAERPVPTRPTRPSAPDERRILVIANETVGGRTLRDTIHEKSEGYREEVLVVTPALNSPLKHWASDEDAARAAAQQRPAPRPPPPPGGGVHAPRGVADPPRPAESCSPRSECPVPGRA